jgi:flagellar biogenesis protein FliO
MDDLYRQFFGIAVVLGALAALLWFAKRRGFARLNFSRPSQTEFVRVLERVPLTPQHTLFVLAIGGRTVLLSSSPGSCQMITDVSEEAARLRNTELPA